MVSDIPLCDGGIFGNIGIPWDLPEEFASVRTRTKNTSIEGNCTQFVGFSDLFDPDEEEEEVSPKRLISPEGAVEGAEIWKTAFSPVFFECRRVLLLAINVH